MTRNIEVKNALILQLKECSTTTYIDYLSGYRVLKRVLLES